MSGKVTLSHTHNQYCNEHEGEVKKFYCKTCKKLVCRDCIVMKQCCRDHDYVTLKDAAAEKLKFIQKEMKKCDGKKREYQDAMQKAQMVKYEIASAVSDAKNGLQSLKKDYFDQLEELFARKEDDLAELEQEKLKDLDEAHENLQDAMEQIKSAGEEGKALVDSCSHYDVVANYDSVMAAMQEVNQMELDEVDAELAVVPKPTFTCVLDQRWKQIGQFEVDTNPGRSIAVASDGKFAVCNWYSVKVYSKSGDLLHTIDDDDDDWLGGFRGVSVTSTNGYVVIHRNKCSCRLYTSDYKLVSEFPTYNANRKPCIATAVAVDKNGCIILGMKDNAISIHNADGSLKSSFSLPFQPFSVAVTSHEEIVISGSNDTLQLFDYSGKCIQTLDPPPEVESWLPWYVCCSKTDEVFVVDMNWSAIYKYAAGRVYMGCVTSEVYDPRGIALSHDDQELYVTDYCERKVKIFQRP